MIHLQWRSVAGLGLVAGLSVVSSNAFTYSDGDVILAFRKDGRNDVTHNLGPITTFLNVPSGQTVPVTNWDRPLTLQTYDNNLTDGVQVALIASTGLNASPRTCWVTRGDPASEPVLPTASGWQTYWSKISSVGLKLAQLTGNSSAQSVSIGSTEIQSYTYIMSNAGSQPGQIPFLGGASKFIVESTPPLVLPLVALQPSTANPKPVAPIVGQFTLTADGVLTFTAGGGTPPIDAPVILGTQANETTFTVTFSTQASTQYRLLGSPESGITAPLSEWTVVAGPVAGAGAPAALSDPTTRGNRMYRVEAFR